MSDAPPPAEHPEAHGFGSQRRWPREIAILGVLLVTLPLLVIWGARELAEVAAVRLPPSMDEKLGRPSWEALKLSGQRCEDPAARRYVAGLLDPLVAALGETPFRFELMLVDADEVNAFALPGGFVVVNSGLLAEAKTGEEVAAVLAHELSHVTLRHSTKRIAGGLGVSAALGLVLGIVDIGAPAYTLSYLASLGYERGQEREADEHGQALLERAGISPLGMATFFERLSNAPSPPELLSTHPDPGDRAARARAAAEAFQPRVVLPAPVGVACSAK
ncbi:MAG TPA: M48 family metallopeptidase [Polyangiaceae bacterium]|nr:M48 family metallopeptidase [Polyangiaceae bacterium]